MRGGSETHLLDFVLVLLLVLVPEMKEKFEDEDENDDEEDCLPPVSGQPLSRRKKRGLLHFLDLHQPGFVLKNWRVIHARHSHHPRSGGPRPARRAT